MELNRKFYNRIVPYILESVNLKIKDPEPKYIYHAMCGYLLSFDLKNVEDAQQMKKLAKWE